MDRVSRQRVNGIDACHSEYPRESVSPLRRFWMVCRLTGNYCLGICAIPLLDSEFSSKQLKLALRGLTLLKRSQASALKGCSDRADIQWSRGELDPRCATGLPFWPLKFLA